MPALPPKLGKNPTPEEVESYREQLEEFQKVLAEKEKAQKAITKEQDEREAENTRSQARLEKWKQQFAPSHLRCSHSHTHLAHLG